MSKCYGRLNFSAISFLRAQPPKIDYYLSTIMYTRGSLRVLPMDAYNRPSHKNDHPMCPALSIMGSVTSSARWTNGMVTMLRNEWQKVDDFSYRCPFRQAVYKLEKWKNRISLRVDYIIIPSGIHTKDPTLGTFQDFRWALIGSSRCNGFPQQDFFFLAFARFGLKMKAVGCSCAWLIFGKLRRKAGPTVP